MNTKRVHVSRGGNDGWPEGQQTVGRTLGTFVRCPQQLRRGSTSSPSHGPRSGLPFARVEFS